VTLRAVPVLPPRWDGVLVEWTDLGLTGGSMDLHFPPKCETCGDTRPPWRSGGTLQLGRDPHTGRTVRRFDLYAERCQGCLADVVYDERTDETWALGPEDYGPEGSEAVEGTLW
jgi:hypothetical protein